MKSLESHITESLQDTKVIEQILTRLEPKISAMVERSKQAFIEEWGSTREWLPYHDEWTRLMLTYKLCASIEQYTQSGDTLVKIHSSKSGMSLFTIDCTVSRNNIDYQLTTTVTRAGGYNIQCAHYRYLTSTNLPKTNTSIVTKELSERIKKLSKNQKLLLEIEQYEDRISKNVEKLQQYETYTDEQKIKQSFGLQYADSMWRHINLQHHEIDKESHNWSQYKDDKAGWDKKQADWKIERLQRFEDIKKFLVRDNTMYQKSITKLKSKLSAL